MKHFFITLLSLGFISTSDGAFFKESPPQVGGFDVTTFQSLGALNIGYIVAEHTSCTATILNPKTILTAAHCISKENDWVEDNKIVFHIALNGGQPRVLQVRRKWTPTQSPLSNYASPLGSHLLDIALLEPIEDLQLNKTISLSKTLPDERSRLLNIGVTHFVKSIIVLNENCQIKNNFHNNVYNLNCGGIYGMSGSGFFINQNGSLNIAGILTGFKSKEAPFKLIDYSDEMATYGIFFDDSSPVIREMRKYL